MGNWRIDKRLLLWWAGQLLYCVQVRWEGY
jgi:hypothetical protein